MLPLETLPPLGDPSGGVVYLRIVLSPEQASHLWMFLNISVLQGMVVSTSPNPQAGGPTLVGCLRLLIQYIRSYPPYRRPFLYPQPEDTLGLLIVHTEKYVKDWGQAKLGLYLENYLRIYIDTNSVPCSGVGILLLRFVQTF